MKGELQKSRGKILNTIKGLDAKVEKIMSDKSMIRSDRVDLVQNAYEGIRGEINKHTNEMITNYHKWLNNAKSKYESARKIDKYDLQARASVLVPALANASDDDLLLLFEKRAGDRIDREVIKELIQIRADKSTADINYLQDKLNSLDNSTVDQLPEVEKAARVEYETALTWEGYLYAAIKEAEYEQLKYNGGVGGKTLQGQDAVQLSAAKWTLDQMDAGNEVDYGRLKLANLDSSKEATNTAVNQFRDKKEAGKAAKEKEAVKREMQNIR